MYYYILNEFKKLVSNRKVILGYAAGLIFTSIFLIFFKTDGGYARTVYDAVRDILEILESTNFYVFVIGFCTFLYTSEYELKTIKVIRSKPVSLGKFLIGKYVASIAYSFLFFAVLLAFTLALANILFDPADFFDAQLQNHIAASEGLKYALLGYSFQAFATIFTISIILFFSILFENGLIALIGSFTFHLFGHIVGKKYLLYHFTPFKYLEIWSVLYQQHIQWGTVILYCLALIGFTILVFILSYVIMIKKEVYT